MFIKDKVQIYCPKFWSKVSTPTKVRGRVNHAGVPVQLYVFSKDRKWYLQKPVVFNNKNFVGEVSFGDAATPNRRVFKLAAVITSERPESPVDSLNNIAFKMFVRLRKSK